MSDRWRERAYSASEAATMAGIQRATLDVWVNRNPGIQFSEKRKSRRWFSAHDIACLRLATELERCGWTVADGLRAAQLALAEPPAPDAIMMLAGEGTMTISTADLAALQIDTTRTLIPLGRMASAIEAATAELFQRAA